MSTPTQLNRVDDSSPKWPVELVEGHGETGRVAFIQRFDLGTDVDAREITLLGILTDNGWVAPAPFPQASGAAAAGDVNSIDALAEEYANHNYIHVLDSIPPHKSLDHNVPEPADTATAGLDDDTAAGLNFWWPADLDADSNEVLLATAVQLVVNQTTGDRLLARHRAVLDHVELPDHDELETGELATIPMTN